MRFEKRAAKHLQLSLPSCEVIHGQWLEYWDDNGHGWAQPDIIVESEDRVLVCECKLTQTEFAFHQLSLLYLPLLRTIYERPLFGVQICRNVHERPALRVKGLDDFISPENGALRTWHLII